MRSPSPLSRSIAGLAAVVLGAAAAHAADPTPPGVPTSPEANPPGPVMAGGTNKPPASDGLPAITPSTPDMKAVQDLLGRATDAMAAGGHSGELTGMLARHDRDRMAGAPSDAADLDAAAAAFRAAWQARFGASFKVSDKIAIVFTEPDVHVAGVEPPPAAPSTQPTPQRKTAVTLALTGPGNRSTVTIHLANEGTAKADWHFDLPDSVTAATLHDTVLRNLGTVTAAHAQWPTDVDQAYVFVAEHLLASMGSVATK